MVTQGDRVSPLYLELKSFYMQSERLEHLRYA
jgi:hypothetical protein